MLLISVFCVYFLFLFFSCVFFTIALVLISSVSSQSSSKAATFSTNYSQELVSCSLYRAEASVLELLLPDPVHTGGEIGRVDVNERLGTSEWPHNEQRQPQRAGLVRFTERTVWAVTVTVSQFSLVTCDININIQTVAEDILFAQH